MEKEKFLTIYKEFNIAHKNLTNVIHFLQDLENNEGSKESKELLEFSLNNANIKLEKIRELVDDKFK